VQPNTALYLQTTSVTILAYTRISPYAGVHVSFNVRRQMEPEAHSKNWVTIQHFYHPTEAHIAAGRLESEAIPIFLLSINHSTANWLMTTALGGIQLQVPGSVEDEARQILAESFSFECTEEEARPSCGSLNTSVLSGSWRIALLAVHLFSIPLPWKKDRRSCSDCRNEWSTRAAI
jgi:hypothetical protein